MTFVNDRYKYNFEEYVNKCVKKEELEKMIKNILQCIHNRSQALGDYCVDVTFMNADVINDISKFKNESEFYEVVKNLNDKLILISKY